MISLPFTIRRFDFAIGEDRAVELAATFERDGAAGCRNVRLTAAGETWALDRLTMPERCSLDRRVREALASLARAA